MTDRSRTGTLALAGLLLSVAFAPSADAVLQVLATDATIATVAATPTSSDPGPRLFSTADPLTFSKGLTDVLAVWYAEVTSATNNSTQSAITAGGTTFTVADLMFARQNLGTSFTTVRAVGVFDSNAAAYAAPPGATKSSQGTLALRSYDTVGNPDGGAAATRFWIYDAVTNTYYVDVDQDMTVGAATVNPASKPLQLITAYTFAFSGNAYAVSNVGASPQYLPTSNLGWAMDLLSSTNDLYVLVDPPSGAQEDTYSYTIRVTAVAV